MTTTLNSNGTINHKVAAHQANAALNRYRANFPGNTVLVWEARATDIYVEVQHDDGSVSRLFISYEGSTLRNA